MLNAQSIKLIFGLKLRQLRREKGIPPKRLAKLARISVSYLNEIEKGKKYPKAEKIAALANVLDLPYDDLVSLKLQPPLDSVGELLQTNFLHDLALDQFGLSTGQLIDIIANAPVKVTAFIRTLIEIGRNYEVQKEQFYFAALRTYQELQDNYFEDLEEKTRTFSQEFGIAQKPPVNLAIFSEILQKQYSYKIDEEELNQHEALKRMRSIFIRQKKANILLLNKQLNDAQKAFQLGKELGYQYLQLKERTNNPTWLKVDSFEQVFNNYKASYFAGALLINEAHVVQAFQQFFQADTWDGARFLAIMHSYQVSPETFMHRLTSIFPRHFGLNQLFFLRFHHVMGDNKYMITKELHLPTKHNPHRNEINEHYCRRWIAINIIKDLTKEQQAGTNKGAIVRVQRSVYLDADKEYFCISVARAMYPTPDVNSSVTIGFLVNKTFKSKVKYWNHPQIPVRFVNETCERCRLTDCSERAIAASVLNQKMELDKLAAVVEKVKNKFVERF